MTTDGPEAPPAARANPPRKVETSALAGLAHPLRVQIFESLTQYGPATATQLAERLGESSGSTSYHLRQLERYGFVETDPDRGTGRERWWRRVPGGVLIAPPTGTDDASGRAAFDLVIDEIQRRRRYRHDRWMATASEWPAEWQDASNELSATLRLTAAETCQLVAEIDEVVSAWRDRTEQRPLSDEVQVVEVQHSTFPLPPVGGIPG